MSFNPYAKNQSAKRQRPEHWSSQLPRNAPAIPKNNIVPTTHSIEFTSAISQPTQSKDVSSRSVEPSTSQVKPTCASNPDPLQSQPEPGGTFADSQPPPRPGNNPAPLRTTTYQPIAYQSDRSTVSERSPQQAESASMATGNPYVVRDTTTHANSQNNHSRQTRAQRSTPLSATGNANPSKEYERSYANSNATTNPYSKATASVASEPSARNGPSQTAPARNPVQQASARNGPSQTAPAAPARNPLQQASPINPYKKRPSSPQTVRGPIAVPRQPSPNPYRTLKKNPATTSQVNIQQTSPQVNIQQTSSPAMNHPYPKQISTQTSSYPMQNPTTTNNSVSNSISNSVSSGPKRAPPSHTLYQTQPIQHTSQNPYTAAKASGVPLSQITQKKSNPASTLPPRPSALTTTRPNPPQQNIPVNDPLKYSSNVNIVAPGMDRQVASKPAPTHGDHVSSFTGGTSSTSIQANRQPAVGPPVASGSLAAMHASQNPYTAAKASGVPLSQITQKTSNPASTLPPRPSALTTTRPNPPQQNIPVKNPLEYSSNVHMAAPGMDKRVAPKPAPTHGNQVSSYTSSTSSTTIQANRQPAVGPPVAPRSLAAMRPSSWGKNTDEVPMIAQHVTSKTKNRPELPGEELLPNELYYDPDSIKPIKDEYRQKLVNNAKLSKPMLNGWTLYPHQKRAILIGLMKRRVVLALDMGLGKTLIGCVWSRSFKLSFDGLKIFVICPVSLKGEWKRTAEEATGLKVEEAKGTAEDSLDLQICSWAKVPTKVDPSVESFVAIFDEAHSMQSIDSGRTKNSLKLIADDRCVGVLLLTGTPMKNGKCSNLYPLLKAVRHPLARHQKAYETHFCAGMMKNFGRGHPQWDASGCSNLKQLKRLVESNLLHLTKEQCLSELPPLTRVTRRVPISSRCQNRYTDAIKELAKIHEAARNSTEMNKEAVLGATQRLRVLCAFAKIEATVELTKTILESEPAVVIFTNFAKAAKQIHQHLADSGWCGELLIGDTPQKKRQGLVDNFQAGLSPVFVCTFGAGGVGLTLTAASTIILLDRPWTPGEMRQAEDRIRRIGQTKSMKSIWMSAFELDAQVDAMLEAKMQATNAVLADGRASGGGSTGIDIQRLVHSIISKVA